MTENAQAESSASATPSAEAYLSRPTTTANTAAASSGPTAKSNSKHETRLYIGNLHTTVDEYTLIQTFSKFGKISKLDFLFHKSGPQRGQPRGYAFVEYASPQEAMQAVVGAHDKTLRGRRISVTFASKNSEGGGDAGGVGPHRRDRRAGETEAVKTTQLSLAKNAKQPQGYVISGIGWTCSREDTDMLLAMLLIERTPRSLPWRPSWPSYGRSRRLRPLLRVRPRLRHDPASLRCRRNRISSQRTLHRDQQHNRGNINAKMQIRLLRLWHCLTSMIPFLAQAHVFRVANTNAMTDSGYLNELHCVEGVKAARHSIQPSTRRETRNRAKGGKCEKERGQRENVPEQFGSIVPSGTRNDGFL